MNVAVGRELGWPLTEDDVVREFVGRSSASIRSQLAERLGECVATEWERRFDELHREAVDLELKPVDGILDALDAIAIRSCIASGGTHAKMRHTLGRTGLFERFSGRIFSATEVSQGKPAPDLFLFAAAQMRIAPAACLVVEDSQYGVQAARAAGMRSLGYSGGLTPASRLEGAGTVVFDDMRALPGLLGLA